MANVFVNEDSLSDIADAIRSKLNVQTTYKPGEMAAAIESISGGSVNNQNKTVHPSSSDQSITADTGYTGLGTVSVKAVTMSNLSATNIVEGVTVKIGDADDDDSIASVTGSASGGITPTGTKQISITQNGTTTEDVTNYASAEITVNVSGGSSTNYGKANVTNILEMLYALEHGTLATGEFTVSSYFPANTESVLFDTGLGETVRGIIICDEQNAYDASTENLFMNFSCFYPPESPGDDQSPMVASSFIRYRGNVAGTFFATNRINSYRVNGGKLYMSPKYAQTNYTNFQKGHTYRWFAWPYVE